MYLSMMQILVDSCFVFIFALHLTVLICVGDHIINCCSLFSLFFRSNSFKPIAGLYQALIIPISMCPHPPEHQCPTCSDWSFVVIFLMIMIPPIRNQFDLFEPLFMMTSSRYQIFTRLFFFHFTCYLTPLPSCVFLPETTNREMRIKKIK
jgi:hypothetical protein